MLMEITFEPCVTLRELTVFICFVKLILPADECVGIIIKTFALFTENAVFELYTQVVEYVMAILIDSSHVQTRHC